MNRKPQRPQKLLADATSNTKLRKSQTQDYRIVSLSLSPADEALTGKSNCPAATAGCISCCVGSPRTGMAAVFQTIMAARAARTRYLQEDREGFLRQISDEIDREQRRAAADGRTLVVRLNTFSDIPWESKAYSYPSPRTGRTQTIFEEFPEIIGYDYTKLHKRIGRTPTNYHLVGSWSEKPEHQESCVELLLAGHNVAVSFATSNGGTGWKAYDQALPQWCELLGHRFNVLDGDVSDLRFTDRGPSRSGRGNVIGIRLKAGSNATRAAAIDAGFAIWRG